MLSIPALAGCLRTGASRFGGDWKLPQQSFRLLLPRKGRREALPFLVPDEEPTFNTSKTLLQGNPKHP